MHSKSELRINEGAPTVPHCNARKSSHSFYRLESMAVTLVHLSRPNIAMLDSRRIDFTLEPLHLIVLPERVRYHHRSQVMSELAHLGQSIPSLTTLSTLHTHLTLWPRTFRYALGGCQQPGRQPLFCMDAWRTVLHRDCPCSFPPRSQTALLFRDEANGAANAFTCRRHADLPCC